MGVTDEEKVAPFYGTCATIFNLSKGPAWDVLLYWKLLRQCIISVLSYPQLAGRKYSFMEGGLQLNGRLWAQRISFVSISTLLNLLQVVRDRIFLRDRHKLPLSIISYAMDDDTHIFS